jgi:threonine dehydrogenase-like Zn-dependent dehydrogenase
MRALVLEPGRAPRVRELDPPARQAGEVRVRVLEAGVCATDLALARGYMGFRGVPGHEFVGLALEGPLAGRRVVGEINAGCGACARCAAGDPRHCAGRTVLGILGRPGAFADELVLPAANLVAVPDALASDRAVFAEPWAAALALAEAAELRPGARALVAGDGRLGLLCAWALADAGLAVEVLGRHPERARLLPPGVPLRVGLLEERAARPAESERVPLAVEATGDPAVLQRLLPWVRPRGTIALKTTSERAAELDLAPLVVDELRLVGSRCGRLAPALARLAAGGPPVERWIRARYPLERAPEALAHAARAGVLKVLIDVAHSP